MGGGRGEGKPFAVRQCACAQVMNSEERTDKHSLLVALIEKPICSSEGQVVQVMPAPVQHPSKPCWNT